MKKVKDGDYSWLCVISANVMKNIGHPNEKKLILKCTHQLTVTWLKILGQSSREKIG